MKNKREAFNWLYCSHKNPNHSINMFILKMRIQWRCFDSLIILKKVNQDPKSLFWFTLILDFSLTKVFFLLDIKL